MVADHGKPDWAYEGSMDFARREAIIAALVHCNQNVSFAAKRLKIGRSTIYRLLQEFEIDVPEPQRECLPRPNPQKRPEQVKVDPVPASRGRLIEIAGVFYMVR